MAHQAWLPTLVVAAGVVVTIFLYQALEHRERELTQVRFESIAEDHIQTIERRIQDVFEAVHLMAGFHQGAPRLSPRDFEIYARSLRHRRPGLRMLVWAPRVEHEQRRRLEEEVRAHHDLPFAIRQRNDEGELVPAEERDVYYPVLFIHPFEPHKPIWGLDLAARAPADEALDRASESGELTATAPIILHSELDAMRSIWAFQAVYDQFMPDDDATMAGVVAGVFEPREMIHGILPVFVRGDILLEIRDAEAAEPYDLVYHSVLEGDQSGDDAEASNESDEPDRATPSPRWRMVAAEAADEVLPFLEEEALEEHEIVHRETINVGARRWQVRAMPSNDFLQAQRTWAPLAVLVGGLGVTVLLGLYLNNVLTRARQVEQEVDQRTAELREMTGALRRSNQSLEEFAYIASHDLQEPLRKVRGFSEMLMADAGDQLAEQHRDYLERMQNAVTRMQDLISGLLAYSRVTTQSQEPQVVDLTQIVHQVVADLELRIRETNGNVTVADLPEIEADPVQMRQLFQNLISNGLKFHRPDVPPRVEVRGEMLRSGRCRIEVTDNGIGLPSDEVDRIFKPYQRLHRRDAYDGTGMGLPVCKKIVERHGGTITARGEPNHGATFTVILPCHQTLGDAGHGWSQRPLTPASDG